MEEQFREVNLIGQGLDVADALTDEVHFLQPMEIPNGFQVLDALLSFDDEALEIDNLLKIQS